MFWASSKRRDKSLVKKTKLAYVFPGQGSQTVGMGSDLYQRYSSARDVFDEVDSTLGFSLSRLCFDGPEDELTQTINVQPAVLTVSIACLKVAEEVSGNALPFPDVVAGHSLGEYTALVVAGVLSLSEAVRLVRERGRLMHEAGHVKPGGMLAVLGLDEEAVREVCLSTGTEISNINCPGQIVVSGAEARLIEFKKQAETNGARRIVPLKVSGAFHSQLMQSASDGLKETISEFAFHEPLVPVMANVTAQMLLDAKAIKEELVDQIISCVRWQQSVENMIAGSVTTFFEIGHGQVLAGLIKRINPAARVINVGDADVDNQVEKLWAEYRRERVKGLVEKAT
ncbi:MAG: ACP S-malonyltransferase [Chloroflexota bacterium]|nr:MAG: ACP S-malonyltransferase [Chloroflexota bacterium]